MKNLFVLTIFCCYYWFIKAFDGSGLDGVTLYTDISLVNTSDSLKRLRALPIVYYKFLYDSIPDRIQLGVIGPDAQRLFPESIEVLPSTAFIIAGQKDNSTGVAKPHQPVTVTNFPIVDKNVLYMHGLAAVQELITEVSRLQGALTQLESHSGDYKREYESLQMIIQTEADHQLRDQLELLQLEYINKQKEIQLQELQQNNEKEKLLKQLNEEKQLLQYEETLSKERLLQQEQIIRQNIDKQLLIEKEINQQKEQNYQNIQKLSKQLKENYTIELENSKLYYEKEKIRIEMEARINQEKYNEEMNIRKLQMQSKLDTERMIETIKNISNQIIIIFKNIFQHPKQLLMISSIIVLLVLSYFFIKELSNLIRQFIQSNIGKPLLVRETSYHWSLFPTSITSILSFISNIFTMNRNKEKYLNNSLQRLEKEFANIILSKEDKERIIHLALATKNTKQSGSPYRHVLLHGPPGTGKTLIARRLATSSGMDYAILSGGDIAPLGEDAVTQLHALFRWAKKSSKGLLVFIDEAEAFLSSRNHIFGETGTSDTHIRNALNALLYQTGTPSNHFMMILATNRPEDLDSAILDRIDVSIQISLPKVSERIDLIHLYSDLHIMKLLEEKTVKNFVLRGLYHLLKMELCPYSIETNCLDENTVRFIAEQIDGFSGREISKLMISVQYGLVLSSNGQLTWKLLKEIIKNKLLEHYVKNHGFQALQSSSYSSIQIHLDAFDRYEPSNGDSRKAKSEGVVEGTNGNPLVELEREVGGSKGSKNRRGLNKK